MLRLLVCGHDVKSIARDLSISIAATNERLRSARLKLGVSSSREAARILASEEGVPSFSVHKKKGVPSAAASSQSTRMVLVWIGVAMAIGIAGGMLLLSLLGAAQQSASPKVVRTNPSTGAVVAPGPLMLSVTFDRPMRPGHYSFVQKDAATYPNCGQNLPTQSRDGRTFTLACKVEPGRSYEIWFNNPPYMSFMALDGNSAIPYQLRFRAARR